MINNSVYIVSMGNGGEKEKRKEEKVKSSKEIAESHDRKKKGLTQHTTIKV